VALDVFAGLVVLVFLGLGAIAVFDRPLFQSFVRSITSLEITVTGFRLRRAATQVEEAVRTKGLVQVSDRNDLRNQLRRLVGEKAIVWVDDHPENRLYASE